MTTLLIGATGATGRAVLAEATEPLRAFARRPETLGDVADMHEVVQGDVNDPASLVRALDGVDTVISVLGSRPGRKDRGLLANGTRRILETMVETGTQRLICVTGMGAGDSRGRGPWWYDALVRPTILRGVYADKENQEELIRASGTQWVIVRPAVLTNDSAPRRAVVARGPLERGTAMGAVSRHQVARFLLGEAAHPQWQGQTVHLFTESGRGSRTQ